MHHYRLHDRDLILSFREADHLYSGDRSNDGVLLTFVFEIFMQCWSGSFVYKFCFAIDLVQLKQIKLSNRGMVIWLWI